MAFSFSTRLTDLKKAENTVWDIIVIGGGITGAGILLDAQSRGLNAVLVEKEDFAWGTSSRSTKLIHGGLRYLKQMDIQLVREVGKERAIVHKNARNLVCPERMLLPIYSDGSLGWGLTSLGLKVYDWLAGVPKDEQRKMLSAEKTLLHEPLLKKDNLKGGGLYYEYRTDDARLTISVIKTACQQGAIALNHAEVKDFTYNKKGLIDGIKLIDHIHANQHTLRSKVVINAAGPWVDDVRSFQKNTTNRHLFLTKGIHIVVDQEKLPLKQSAYFDAVDQRMMFAIPRGNIVYIGTTDTPYNDNTNHPYPGHDDVDYILQSTLRMFPDYPIEKKDIQSTWSGLRPLIQQEGKGPSELSRRDEIFESKDGLLSIAGGKLTGYRKMAERIVNRAQRIIGKRLACQTQHLVLYGQGFDSTTDVQHLCHRVNAIINGPDFSGERLVHLYGHFTMDIIERAQAKSSNESKLSLSTLLQAELEYTIEHERVCSLSDFIIQRSGMLYFDRARIDQHQELLNNVMSAHTQGIPTQFKDAQEAHLQKAYQSVIAFR
ncbi:MAG TPA: glycerol-3-phosphate dehydrogenase [Bacteroidetes bacterium]|nr:glycerol-3-phosphate dehydrogenase [Bacteroidota bacterium]